MTHTTRAILMAATIAALLAALQIAASAQPLSPRTPSMTADQASIVMASDRGWYSQSYGRSNWGGGSWRGDNNWGGYGYRDDRRRDRDDRWRDRDDYRRGWDRDRDDHDNTAAWVIGGALLGYLLSR